MVRTYETRASDLIGREKQLLDIEGKLFTIRKATRVEDRIELEVESREELVLHPDDKVRYRPGPHNIEGTPPDAKRIIFSEIQRLKKNLETMKNPKARDIFNTKIDALEDVLIMIANQENS